MGNELDKYIDYDLLDNRYNRSIGRISLERQFAKPHGNAISQTEYRSWQRIILNDCLIDINTKNKISIIERDYILKKIENDFYNRIEWIPDGCHYETYFHDEKTTTNLPVIPKSIWESIPIYIILMLVFSIFNEVILAWSAITIFYICWIIIEIKSYK